MKNILITFFVFLSSSILLLGQTYTSTGSMNTDRFAHETQLLYTGKVLAFGGDNFNGINQIVYKSAQLYNPSTGTWTNTSSMDKLRTEFASVVLPNGNVLAIGGQQTMSVDPRSASCEIYNVQTGTWSYTDSMHVARSYHAAISLRNGQVLVVGGIQDNTCELYNPSTNKWSFTSSPSIVGRDGTSLIMLGDGKILATSEHDAEIYNPDTEIWTLLTSKLIGDRQNHSSVLLNNGNVLITGGSNFGDQTTAELFNAGTMTFTAAAEMSANRASSKAILLDNGKVLAYGLGDFTSATNTKLIELYDPATNTWSSQVYHTIGTQGYNINKLGNGKILISGGSFTTFNGATPACFLIDQNLTGCTLPSISMTATGQSICYGNTGNVTLNTTENGIIYTVKLGNTTTAQAVGTGSSLTIPINASVIQAGDNVYTVYANTTGCTSLLLSDTAIIKTSVTTTKPIITSSGNSICIGDSAKLSAPAGYSFYKWNTFAAAAFIYTKNVGDYTIEVTSANGCKSLPSDAVHISTNPILTTSISISTNKTTIIAGDLATFTATSTNGGTAPVYTWSLNNIVSGTGNPFSTTALLDGDVVSCKLLSNALCAKPASLVSNSITMVVKPFVDHPRVISTTPASNAQNIANKQDISITFSKAMFLNANLDSIIRVFGSYSGKIKGTYSGIGTNTIIFSPSQYTLPGEKISVAIDSAARDVSGISMSYGYVLEFNSAAATAPAEFVDGASISGLANPSKITPADFNNDHQMDFISSGSGGVQIWINQGNGTYSTTQNLAVQYGNISEIGVADLNNDGNIDVYITYTYTNLLSVFLNNNLAFTKKDYMLQYNTDKAFPGDFDGDADIDIALKTNSSPNVVVIVKNDGQGNFNTGNYLINTSGNSFKIADFDNDGDLDILLASLTIQLLKNDGKATFTSSIIPNPPLGQNDYAEIVSLGDYDNNGFMDIMLIFNNSIGIMKNIGNGNFLAYDTIGSYPRGIVNIIKEYPSADFDGDGDLDLAITAFKISGNDSIDVWTNNSHGKFTLTKRSSLGITTGLYNLVPMDIDGDGDIDIAAPNRYLNTTFLKLNGGTKTTISSPVPDKKLCTSFPTKISLTKSGVFNTGNIFKLQLSDKNGNFNSPLEIGTATTNTAENIIATIPSSVPDGTHYRLRIVSTIPAIISNDNGFDITISSTCNILTSITPLSNVHDVNASQIVIAAFTQEPQIPTSGININGSFSGSYLNKGLISKSSNSIIFTQSNYFAGENITITIDSSFKSTSGQSVINSTTSTFTVGSRTAPALFSPYKPIDSTNMGNVHRLSSVGDLNGDGKIDVIAVDGATSDLNVFFNLGDGSFAEKKSIYNQLYQINGTSLFDYDNDGDLDIFAPTSLGNILILKNDGQANFTVAQTIVTDCQYFRSGDLNNDGFIDFICVGNTGLINIFLNKNKHFDYASSIQLTEYIASLSVNDIDNDGDQDIVCGTGSNLYLFSNIYSGSIFKKRIVDTDFWGSNLVVADFNNDKLLDIAGDSKILFNDINTTFSNSKTINLGGSFSNLNVADFNGDNNVDLFFQSAADYTSTYITLGDGTGAFPILRKIKNSAFAFAADLDNDRDIDLISYTNFIGSSIRSFINDVSLTTKNISSTKFCAENTINVQFASRGIPEDILYSAQLSDAAGNFTSPVIIGTGKTSPITCSIPSASQLGNAYKIRIVCDSLHLTGTDNGINLTITTDCPSVSSLQPSLNDNTAAAATDITATFNKDMLATSANASTFRVFKNYSGFASDKGSFAFPDSKSIAFNPDQNYFAGEKVSVTLSKKLENTDQTPLTHPFVYNFNVQPESSKGSFYMKDDVFTNFNQQQMGVKAADLDNDGDLDLVTLYSYENKVSIRLNNNGYFTTKTDYISGENPVDLSISDIDSDGDADIITINYSGDPISVFKNNGDATFTKTASLRFSGFPICSADFDGDGDMDFATPRGCSTNDGTGNFKETFVFPYLGYNIYTNLVTSADIDADGDMDIILTTYGASYSVTTFINNGEATFTQKNQYNVPNQINYLYTADFNNDGMIDFAACDGSSKSLILGINNNGTFLIETRTTQNIAYRLDGGDIDGDGDIDLLVPNIYPMGLSILKNDGAASFTSAQFIDMGNIQPDRITPFDIDNDGDLDIAMTGANELRVLINGEASLATHPLTNISICGGETFTVPFTLYGLSTVTTFNAELSDATGSFANNTTVIGTGATSPLNVIIPNSITAGNTYRIRVVTSDGSIIGTDNGTNIDLTQGCLKIASLMPDRNSADIASANFIVTNFTTDLMSTSINEQNYRIYGNQSGFSSDKGTISLPTPSSISFKSNRNFFPNEKITVSLTTQIKSADNINLSSPFVYEFNVKPAVSSGKFFVKQSNYSENINYNLGYSNSKLIRSGDFDNDGDLDVAIINGGTSQLSIYLNTDKKLKSKTVIPCDGDPRRLDVMDINADGYLDLITVNQYSISLYLNKGDGNFILKNSFSLSNIPAGLAVADFNGDGNMDYATCAFPKGISVNTNTGNETFNEQVVELTETDDVIDMASMDIDTDGDMDIIAYSSDPYNLYAFENNGNGIFSYKNKICNIHGACGIQVADLNNDNKMDFIMPININGGYYIGLNDGNNFTVTQIDYPYFHVYFDLADIDGDGDIDLICSSLDYKEGITIMKNDGTGTFTISETLTVNTAILQFAPNDIDNDGDLDIVCANESNIGLLTLYNGAAPIETTNPTSITNASLKSIQIYPNPTFDYITIESPDAIEEIIVLNMLGKEVLKESRENKINMKDLSSGIYTIKITTETGIFIQKIYKE